MKNKEEPSIDLTRGNPSTPASRQISRQPQSVETTGSIVRQDGAAPASIEKPALSLFPESLMEAVVTEANVEQAWRNVKVNRGAPGPDGITISEFPAWFRLHWQRIRSQLLDGTYLPQPVRRVTIDKPDGGKRQLGIPTDTGKSTPGQSAFGLCRNRSSLPPAVSTAFLGAEKPDGGGSGVCDTKGVAIRNLFGPQGLDVDTLQRSLPRCWRAANDPAAGASGRVGAARPEAR